ENYCPLNRVVRQWSDRRKVVLEPLFKGYLFVKLPETAKWDIKNTDGIINFVYWLGKPAIVREEEINTIRRFLQEFDNVEVSDTLSLNDKVVVKQGVMMNYSGLVIEVMGNRARVLITSMGVSLSAVFSKKNLEKAEGAG
ncbi:MAG: antitermination protein NusG, partial [Chitinophagaceae bacterium]